MDKFTKAAIAEENKFSDTTKIGFAYMNTGKVVEFLSTTLETSAMSANVFGKKDFVYVGYKTLTPMEELDSELRLKQKIDLDISISDMRKYIFQFEYKGEPIYIELYLPLINRDGTIRISSTKYFIKPIYSDHLLSFESNKVFIRFNPQKVSVSYHEFTHNILSKDNDDAVVKISTFPHSDKLFANRTIAARPEFKPKSPLVLYTLVRSNLATVNSTYGTDVHVIYEKDAETYVKKGYTVYTKGIKQINEIKYSYDRTTRAVALKNPDNSFEHQLALGILYAFEVYPEYDDQYDDTSLFWRNMLASLVTMNTFTSDGMLAELNAHLANLDNYLDKNSRDSLANIGYKNLRDIYHFFQIFVANFDEYIKIGNNSTNTIESKYIYVCYYLTYDIIENFNRAFSEVKKLFLNDINNRKETNIADIKKRITGDYIKKRLIYRIIKSPMILPLVLNASSSDNYLLKTRCLVDLQSRGEGVRINNKRSRAGGIPYEVSTLTATQLLAGNVLFLKKSFTSPLASLNPYAVFNEYGKLQIDDATRKDIEAIDADLSNIAINNTDELKDSVQQNMIIDEVDQI